MSRVTPYGSSVTAAPSPTMAPWVPAPRVGSGPRPMLSGARVFAGLAALVVLTRRRIT